MLSLLLPLPCLVRFSHNNIWRWRRLVQGHGVSLAVPYTGAVSEGANRRCPRHQKWRSLLQIFYLLAVVTIAKRLEPNLTWCLRFFARLVGNSLLYFPWAAVGCTAVLSYKACGALPRSASLFLRLCLGQYIRSDGLPAKSLETVFSISIPAM